VVVYVSLAGRLGRGLITLGPFAAMTPGRKSVPRIRRDGGGEMDKDDEGKVRTILSPTSNHSPSNGTDVAGGRCVRKSVSSRTEALKLNHRFVVEMCDAAEALTATVLLQTDHGAATAGVAFVNSRWSSARTVKR